MVEHSLVEQGLVEPLRGADLDGALEALSQNRGLSPATVDMFLKIDPDRMSKLSGVYKWIPGALFAEYLATYAITHAFPDALPTLGHLPPLLHEFSQGIHNLTVNAANSPALRDHLPYFLLELSVGYTGLKAVPEFFNLKGKGTKTREAQQQVRLKTEAGIMPYAMAKSHSAVFSGAGDWLADQLQDTKPADQVMQYSQVKIDNRVWQKIRQEGKVEELFAAFDRGDFKNAGEIVILPLKKEDMFLPGSTGHDMTLDEIDVLINIADTYCSSRDLEPKRAIIVGRKTMEETYIDRTRDDIVKKKRTLSELVDQLSKRRGGGKVDVTDPTELVIGRIMKAANGAPIVFSATQQSDERYGERFFSALNDMGYAPTGGRPVRAFYNISDKPTEVGAQKDDIAVILDASRKDVLLKRGVKDENIILVPELTLSVLNAQVDES